MKNRPQKDRYLVVANLVTKYDEGLDELFNVKSGISDRAFQAIVRDFAACRNLKFLLERDNTAILVGDAEDKKAFLLENPRFSAAHCNEDSVMRVIDAIFDSDVINRIFEDFEVTRTSVPVYEARLDA